MCSDVSFLLQAAWSTHSSTVFSLNVWASQEPEKAFRDVHLWTDDGRIPLIGAVTSHGLSTGILQLLTDEVLYGLDRWTFRQGWEKVTGRDGCDLTVDFLLHEHTENGTFVVCSPSLTWNWVTRFHQHVNVSLICVFKGAQHFLLTSDGRQNPSRATSSSVYHIKLQPLKATCLKSKSFMTWRFWPYPSSPDIV